MATVLAAEAAGVARWALENAAEYAKVREQFGKPIGSFQAVKHLCAEMLLRSQQIAVAADDAAVAAAGDDDSQLSVAAAVAEQRRVAEATRPQTGSLEFSRDRLSKRPFRAGFLPPRSGH